MPGRDNPIAPRQQFKPWTLRHQPLAGMEKQQRPPLTALDQFETGAGEVDGAGHLAASNMRAWVIMDLLFVEVRPGHYDRPGITLRRMQRVGSACRLPSCTRPAIV